MSKFRVVINFSDGDTEELDDLFDSYEDAEREALEYISNWHAGGEVLELSNPGDYPYEPDDAPDYDIFEEDEDADEDDEDDEDDDENDDE
ncbi:MAG: hypothetical protein H6598_10060 [Flavobacteriales bacterium]|nr:hypothetical protein [Flavobacteriales bacterium]